MTTELQLSTCFDWLPDGVDQSHMHGMHAPFGRNYRRRSESHRPIANSATMTAMNA